MPLPPSPRPLAGPRRRSLLASAAGAALLTGCSGGPDDSGAATGGGPSLADRVRARAARDSQDLAERYDAVIAAHPALAERLRPLRAEVVAHRDAFGGAAAASPGASAGASAGASGTPSPDAPGTSATRAAATASAGTAAAESGAPAGAEASPSGGVPATPRQALASLAAAERGLADRRVAGLGEVPGELARLLASVAAAGAAHAYLLTEGDR
ncbi:hypothetical protein [Streptomyces sp. NPDC004065]|uniref:hypothetical protein n=1 Tax=Streptomyces sp. NPDC004065 TaxID=3364689 RepID=UPI00384B6555